MRISYEFRMLVSVRAASLDDINEVAALRELARRIEIVDRFGSQVLNSDDELGCKAVAPIKFCTGLLLVDELVNY